MDGRPHGVEGDHQVDLSQFLRQLVVSVQLGCQQQELLLPSRYFVLAVVAAAVVEPQDLTECV